MARDGNQFQIISLKLEGAKKNLFVAFKTVWGLPEGLVSVSPNSDLVGGRKQCSLEFRSGEAMDTGTIRPTDA